MEDLATSSSVLAHAYGARAQVYLDSQQHPRQQQDYSDQAKTDARRALEIHNAAAAAAAAAAMSPSSGVVPPLPPPHPSYYRVLVEALEATGDFQSALEVLRQWTDDHPKYATKVAKEVQRVRSKMMGP